MRVLLECEVRLPAAGTIFRSAPTQLMQASIIKPQVVSYFVEQGYADLTGEFIVREIESCVRVVEDGDPVGGDTEVVDAPFGERYTLIDPEEARVLWVLVLCCTALYDHRNILHLCSDPPRESIERCPHCGLKRS